MPLEKIRRLQRTYTPGRHVRFRDTEAVHAKALVGASGTLLQVVPLPDMQQPIGQRDPVPLDAYGVSVEFLRRDGRYDIALCSMDDVELAPFDAASLERELCGRVVDFPRSSGIGLVFPEGAADEGRIVDVQVSIEADLDDAHVTLSLAVPVDPAKHPRGINLWFVHGVDFVQCTLRPKRSPV